ncbi:hypothetical protein AB0H51_11270 [Streptomyces griseoluteus]|uniref:hypothetical protein n=1 Tax=Streptomyces griseoluteus TaxID=29306 RepID=UPI0033D1F929
MAHRTADRPAPAGRPPADFPAALLPYLDVPDLADLTADQAAGRTCVWGGHPIPLAAAVDLGEEIRDGVAAFPQSCGRCIAERAFNALAAHSIDCEPCHGEDWKNCPTGGGLYRLHRDAGRLARGKCR